MFLTHAKRRMVKFDPIKAVLPTKFVSLGCAMVKVGTIKLLYLYKQSNGETPGEDMTSFDHFLSSRSH